MMLLNEQETERKNYYNKIPPSQDNNSQTKVLALVKTSPERFIARIETNSS